MPRFKYDMDSLRELEKVKLAQRWPPSLNREFKNEDGFWDPHRAFGMPLASSGNGNGQSISPQSMRGNSDPKNSRSDSSYSSSGHINRRGTSRERDRKSQKDGSCLNNIKLKSVGPPERIRNDDVLSLGPQKQRNWAEGCHVNNGGNAPQSNQEESLNSKRGGSTVSLSYAPSGDSNSHNSTGNSSSYPDRDYSSAPRHNYHYRGQPPSSYYENDSYSYKGSGPIRGRGRSMQQDSSYNMSPITSSSSPGVFSRNTFGRGSTPRYNSGGFNSRGGYNNYHNMSNASYHGRWDNSYRRNYNGGAGGRYEESRPHQHNNQPTSKDPEWLTDGPENVGETIELHGIHEDDATMRKFKRCEQASSLTSRDEKGSDKKIRKTFDPSERLFMELEGLPEEYDNESDDMELDTNGIHKADSDLALKGLDEFEETAWLLDDPLMKRNHGNILTLDDYSNDSLATNKTDSEKKEEHQRQFDRNQPSPKLYAPETVETIEKQSSNGSLSDFSTGFHNPFSSSLEMKSSFQDDYDENEMRINSHKPFPSMTTSRDMRAELLSIIRGFPSGSQSSSSMEFTPAHSGNSETKTHGNERNAMEAFLKQIILKNSASKHPGATMDKSSHPPSPPSYPISSTVTTSNMASQQVRENVKEPNVPGFSLSKVRTLEEIEKVIINNSKFPKPATGGAINKPIMSQQPPTVTPPIPVPTDLPLETIGSGKVTNEKESSAIGVDYRHVLESRNTATMNSSANGFPLSALAAPPFVPRQQQQQQSQNVPSSTSSIHRQLLSQLLANQMGGSGPSNNANSSLSVGSTSPIAALAKQLQQLKLYQQQQQLLARLNRNENVSNSALVGQAMTNQSSANGFNPAAATFVPRVTGSGASTGVFSAPTNTSPTAASAQRNVSSPSVASSTNDVNSSLSSVQIQNLLRAVRNNTSAMHSDVSGTAAPTQSSQRGDINTPNYMLAAAAAAVAANQCGSNTYRWIKAMSNAISASNRITQMQQSDSVAASPASAPKPVNNPINSTNVSPTMISEPSSDPQISGNSALNGTTNVNNPFINSGSVPISSRPAPKSSVDYLNASYLEPICSQTTRQIIQQQQQQMAIGGGAQRPVVHVSDDESHVPVLESARNVGCAPNQRHHMPNNASQFHQIFNMLQRSRAAHASSVGGLDGHNSRMAPNPAGLQHGSSGFGRQMFLSRQNMSQSDGTAIRGTNFNNNASLLGSPSAANLNNFPIQSSIGGNFPSIFRPLMQQVSQQRIGGGDQSTIGSAAPY